MEQRLIDANALREDWLENGENEYVYDTNCFLASLDAAPTIDPETLPVVQDLRKQVQNMQKEIGDWRFWYGPVREHEAKELCENRAAVNVMRKRCEKTIADLRAELAQVKKERDAEMNDRLPVKPGDKVYQQNGTYVYELEVKKIIFDCGHIAFDESAIGSSLYLSEEAAKTAMAKLVNP